MAKLNDAAPSFTLKNTKKEDVSLSDYKDKTVVLAFYPGAYTGVCDTEMCTLQDNMKFFNDLDVVVLGISVDSPWANGGFAKQYSLDFDLLSDFNRIVVEQYDVKFEGLGGIENYICANRAVFVVKDGVVRYRWDASPNPGVLPDYDAIKSTLETL